MQPLSARIIKSVKFEDGTYAIKPAPEPAMDALVSMEATVPGQVAELVARNVQVEAEAAITAAQEESETLLAMAREEAEAIRAQALAEAEAIKSRAFSESHERGFQEGLKTGHEAGVAQALDHYASQLQQLADATEAAARDHQAWFAENERNLVKLALMIAQKILLMELTTSRDSVLPLAEAALRRLTDRTTVRLRVHPEDMERVMLAKERLLIEVENLSTLEVVPDARIGLGGCVAETKTGMVDARLATQLSQVAATLLELPLGTEAEMDQVVADTVKALAQKGDAVSILTKEAIPPAPPVRSMPMPKPVVQAAPPAPVAPAAPVMAPAPVAAPVTDWAEPEAPAFEPIEELIETPGPEFFAPEVLPTAVEPQAPVFEPLPAAPSDVGAQHAVRLHPEPVEQEEPQQAMQAAHQVETALAPIVHEAPPTPQPTTPSVRTPDPTRRAAEALALRLGQLKKGRGVSTLSEEQQMQLLQGALTDSELEAIVRQVAPKAALDIANDEPLVHNPNLDLAAEALAERLGQNKKKRLDAAQLDAIAQALGDSTIDSILDKIVPHAAGEAPAAEQPNLDSVAERLAERLGKKVRKPVFPEFSTAGAKEPADPFGDALKDDTIVQIMSSITPQIPMEEPEAVAQPDISKASENLAKLLGQKKKGNRAWYEGID